MLDRVVHDEVNATLAWLKTKDPGLGPWLEKAYGYAVFPSMGRASVLLGGATGGGEVFEQGKPIGLATLSQLTIGVQAGGQTFSEVVAFENKRALEAFKKGGIKFTANASAVLVKAAATGTSGTGRRAYSRGGMLLEASIGGQKFKFVPHDFEFLRPKKSEPEAAKESGSGGGERIEAKEPTARALLASSARRLFGSASEKAARFLESHGKKGGRLDHLASMLSPKGGAPR
jgi:hypothetical protein